MRARRRLSARSASVSAGARVSTISRSCSMLALSEQLRPVQDQKAQWPFQQFIARTIAQPGSAAR